MKYSVRSDARKILGDRRNERMRKLREEPSDIVLLERNLARHRRGEPAQAQSIVQENCGHVRRAQKVFEVVVRHDQFGNFLLILAVEGDQLFVD